MMIAGPLPRPGFMQPVPADWEREENHVQGRTFDG